MIINSRREAGRMDIGRDILLKLPTAPRANFLDWTKGRQNYQSGHRALATALPETHPVAKPGVRPRTGWPKVIRPGEYNPFRHDPRTWLSQADRTGELRRGTWPWCPRPGSNRHGLSAWRF